MQLARRIIRIRHLHCCRASAAADCFASLHMLHRALHMLPWHHGNASIEGTMHAGSPPGGWAKWIIALLTWLPLPAGRRGQALGQQVLGQGEACCYE